MKVAGIRNSFGADLVIPQKPVAAIGAAGNDPVQHVFSIRACKENDITRCRRFCQRIQKYHIIRIQKRTHAGTRDSHGYVVMSAAEQFYHGIQVGLGVYDVSHRERSPFGERLEIHTVNIKSEVGCDHRTIYKPGGFLVKHVLDLPGEQDVILEGEVDGQSADKNTTGEHGDDVKTCRDDGHIHTQVDYRVVCFPDKPQADDG